jgi:CheY-like chemotaxis protein
MMPGMNGFEVCSRLKTDETLKYVPVILVTALNSKEDLLQGLNAGADEFLTKPVLGSELRARCRSMLKIKAQQDELWETLRLKEKLTEMIVKDMKSPLTAILIQSELLKGELFASEDTGRVDLILMQAARLNNHLDEILVLARLKAGKPLTHKKDIAVNELITEIVDSHVPVARLKKIFFTSHLPEITDRIFCDKSLVQMALGAIVSAIIKNSEAGSTVIVHTETVETGRETAARIRISSDDGGISPNVFRKLIDSIPETDNASHSEMWFSRQVIVAHDGRAFIENDPTGRFTIVIEL